MNQRDMIKFKDVYLARLANINPSGFELSLPIFSFCFSIF